MNRTSVWIAGSVLTGAFVGWNYYYVEEMAAVLVLFSLIAIPLLALAFGLALAEAAGERGTAWAEAHSGPAVRALATPLRRVAEGSREFLSHHRHAA